MRPLQSAWARSRGSLVAVRGDAASQQRAAAAAARRGRRAAAASARPAPPVSETPTPSAAPHASRANTSATPSATSDFSRWRCRTPSTGTRRATSHVVSARSGTCSRTWGCRCARSRQASSCRTSSPTLVRAQLGELGPGPRRPPRGGRPGSSPAARRATSRSSAVHAPSGHRPGALPSGRRDRRRAHAATAIGGSSSTSPACGSTASSTPATTVVRRRRRRRARRRTGRCGGAARRRRGRARRRAYVPRPRSSASALRRRATRPIGPRGLAPYCDERLELVQAVARRVARGVGELRPRRRRPSGPRARSDDAR